MADRVLLLKLAVKCADAATSAMDPNLYRHASELFFQELHAQGDRERHEGLPISPLCDRTTFNMVEAQTSIMTLMVKPMFECFLDLLGAENLNKRIREQLTSNIEHIPE